MRKLIMVAAILLTGSAWADSATVKVYSLDVKERVQNLELIDVTAEKSAGADAETLDADLQEILEAAAALEEAEED
jgi:hypothetical protein